MKIKVLSYNIHSGKNIWMFPQLKQISRFLCQEKADIIGLQEINENNKRGLQVTALKQALHMNVHFGPNVSIGDGDYGIATYTHYPVLETHHSYLTSNKEQRGFIDTLLQVNGTPVHIINTHLGLKKEEREKQWEEIMHYLQQLKNPFLLLGDFNAESFPSFISANLLKDSATIVKKEHHPTMMLPKKRIDYIFLSKHFHLLHYNVLPAKMSDHYPLMVEVELISNN